MIVKNISNIEGFFNVVDKCIGQVELVTKDGDRLNLKSKLTQYVSLVGMFNDPKMGEVELILSEPEDGAKLLHFLVQA